MGVAAAAVEPARVALDAAVASVAEAELKKPLEKEHADLEAAAHLTTCEAYLAARHSSLSAAEAEALRQEVEGAYRNGFADFWCVCACLKAKLVVQDPFGWPSHEC